MNFEQSLTAEQHEQFEQYLALLLEWNQKMNLTAIREPEEIRVRHFWDALSCIQLMDNVHEPIRLIDVGTGAGFPGLPLKIAFPHIQLTLVDSVKKKTHFLTAVTEALALENVTILAERAEMVGRLSHHRARYDWAVGRGLARLPILLEYLVPLCKVGGHILAQKGETAIKEIEEAKNAIELLRVSAPTVAEVQLPNTDRKHYLLRFTKEQRTSKQYPRQVGIPRKKPL